MEAHDNAGYGGVQTSGQEISRKGHRKINKVSNLHARLCPNFDVRDALKPEKDDPHDKTYLQNHNQEELDPKTMDFTNLLTHLHPSFILNYLQKVQNFLESDLCEMSFPNVAPFMEEFLVRIAQDNLHLACSRFTEENQKAGKHIRMILHENRHHYKWKYIYGGGKYGDK